MYFWRAQEMLPTLGWVLRALVAYGWLLLIARLMGRRQIGELSFVDQIVGITIGSIFAGTLSNPKLPIMNPIRTTGTIAILHIILTYFALNSKTVRETILPGPLVLIENGHILEDNLKRARFNLDNLLSELRLKNLPNLRDVEFAILESNGKLSVIPKSQARPVTPADLGATTSYEGLSAVVVKDGSIVGENLAMNKITRTWLLEELLRQGVQDLDDVLLATLDTQGRLFVSRKGQGDDGSGGKKAGG